MSKYIHFCIIVIVAITIGSCTGTSTKINTAEQLMETAPDSALHILKQIHRTELIGTSNRALYALLMSQALDKNEIKVESDSLITVATDYYNEHEPEKAAYAWLYHARTANNRGDANEQAQNLLKAQGFAGSTKNYKLQGLIFNDKATLYSSQRQFDSMIHYHKLAYQAFRHSNNQQNSILSLLNIGYGFEFISQLDSALQYYQLAKKQLAVSTDTVMLSTINRCIGSVYFQQGDYATALHYYLITPITHNNQCDCNKWYLIGKVYVQMSKLDSAKIYLNRVVKLDDMAPDYYNLMQTIQQKEGNMAEALRYANKITEAKDSINKRRLADSFAGLEKKYRFQHLEIENKNLIITSNRKDIYLLLALMCLSVSALIFLLWRLKVKKNQLNSQAQLIIQERKLIEQEKENNTLLEQQLKLYNILLMNVEHYRTQSKRRYHHNDKNSTNNSSAHTATFYEQLIACMDIQYQNISKRLIQRFPTLSERDILICCLLLAEFNTGMIATILNVKNDSIIVHRSRLRKKLELDNSRNLLDYLSRF